MKALTLTQPWASLVAIGAKTIETRSWRTHHRGWLAIHAAKSFPVGAQEFAADCPEVADALADDCVPPGMADLLLPRGAIIAVVRLAMVRPTEDPDRPNRLDRYLASKFERRPEERSFGDYSFGRFAWMTEDLHPLHEPIPCRGYQGLWTVPADIEQRIRAEVPNVF